jgi:glutathione S-transferase
MKLFFAPEFSSLADHIALLEAGFDVEIVMVDIESKALAGGGSFLDINPTGMVPALMFDDGEVLTENLAILSWVADRAPQLAPAGGLGRYRLLETLSFIASEIHKRFPIYLSLPEADRFPIEDDILRSFSYLAARLGHGYLFDDTFSVADAYLFVMARGALALELPIDGKYLDYVRRIEARPMVQKALLRERSAAAAAADKLMQGG